MVQSLFNKKDVNIEKRNPQVYNDYENAAAMNGPGKYALTAGVVAVGMLLL